jgi:hypothetical protein
MCQAIESFPQTPGIDWSGLYHGALKIVNSAEAVSAELSESAKVISPVY